MTIKVSDQSPVRQLLPILKCNTSVMSKNKGWLCEQGLFFGSDLSGLEKLSEYLQLSFR